MTDITELAQREKFEAWAEQACAAPWGYLKKRRTTEGYSEQIYTCMWTAWKAANAEMVEELEKSESRLHEVAVACATAEQALEKAQQRIEELESDLSEWTDCKHDGATYYDMSGRERCGRCGADL